MATPPDPSSATPADQGETPTPGLQHVAETDPQESNVMEIDDRDEVDSTFGGDGTTTYTASLSSSVLNYTYENGRRYHAYKSGEYPFPNDAREQEREDLKHHIFQMVLGGDLHLCPLPPSPQRILDIGTGTGIWAIDVADQYSSAQVCGIDLSPIQPGWVPPNCSFLVENAEDDWIYSPAQAFDFIHLRALAGSIKDWPKLYSQIFQHLKPGAWVESQENDSTCFSDDDSLSKAKDWVEWMTTVNEVATKFGKVLDVGPRQKQWMIDAGFIDVQEKVFKVPVGKWAKDKKLKEQGMYVQALSVDALEPVSMALFTRVLGMSAQEVQAMLVGPRKDIMNPNLHLYIHFRFVFGRKPLLDEQ